MQKFYVTNRIEWNEIRSSHTTAEALFIRHLVIIIIDVSITRVFVGTFTPTHTSIFLFLDVTASYVKTNQKETDMSGTTAQRSAAQHIFSLVCCSSCSIIVISCNNGIWIYLFIYLCIRYTSSVFQPNQSHYNADTQMKLFFFERFVISQRILFLPIAIVQGGNRFGAISN